MVSTTGVRSLTRKLPPQGLSSLAFSTLASRRSEQHHTYFNKGADHITFPANTRIFDSAHNHPPPSFWSKLTKNQGHNHGPLTPQYDHATQGGNSRSDKPSALQIWSVFLSGFLLFPFAYSYVWAGQWAFGTKAPASEMASWEQQGLGASRGSSQDSNDQFMDPHNLYSILQRANAETKALHDLIHLLINPDERIRAYRDRETVELNPIRMSSGKILPASKATLVNVLAKDGKTLALILGVDMQGHDNSESDPNLDWCHDFALRNWMDARALDLKTRGLASEAGIGLFCYTATSSATSLPGKAENWQEARLFPQDVPEGFPLKVFEKLPAGRTLQEIQKMEEEGA